MNSTINQVVSSIRKLSTTVLIAGGILLSGQANAAVQCKGLDNLACDAQAACGWVQGYERKDGRKVTAFCRAKAQRTAEKDEKSS